MSQAVSNQKLRSIMLPEVRIADPVFNGGSIIAMIDQICTDNDGPQLILFRNFV